MIRSTIYLVVFIFLIAACSSNSNNDPSNPPATPNPNAGSSFSVQSGDPATLDASASSHGDKSVTITSYVWSQLQGPMVSISNSTQAVANFTAPTVSQDTDLIFQLDLRYSNGDQASATITVTILAAIIATNTAPVSDPGVNQTVQSGDSVTLDGSASYDPDTGDTISQYLWSQTSTGNAVNLITTNTNPVATFDAPTVTSSIVLEFTLIVEDSHGTQDSKTVTVTVNPLSNNISYTGRYLPLTTSGTPDQLEVIDTTDLSIIPVETQGFSYYETFFQYQFDASTLEVSNPYPAYGIYLKNNQIWRISFAGDSSLTPQQVGSNSYSNLCSVDVPNKQLNPLNSAILIETSGADGICFGANDTGDNKIFIVRLGDSPNTAAIDASGVIEHINTIPNTYLRVFDNGFLIRVGSTLRYYNADLSTYKDLLTLTSINTLVFDDQTNLVFADNQVMLFDESAAQLSASLGDLGGTPNAFACDAGACVIVKSQSDGSYSFYSLPRDGSASLSPIKEGVTVPLGSGIYSLTLTTNFIFYEAFFANPVNLYRIPRTSSPVTEAPVLVSSSSSSGTKTTFVSIDDKIFYTKITVDS